MTALRLAGVALGLLGIVLASYWRFRQHRLRNGDWLLAVALGAGLAVIGLNPDLLNGLFAVFTFEKGGYRRLVGLLLFSNLILYLLTFKALARGNRLESHLDRIVRETAKREFRRAHPPDTSAIYVVIPAFNEAENIGAVLALVPEEIEGLRTRTVVVVDGATDNTETVVRGLDGATVSYVINRGGGSALKAGYELALEAGAEVIVTLDADGQHLPEELPRLVRPILAGEADLVNGSRVLGSFEKESEVRAAGVVLFNWLVSALALQRITDCSNAFRAIRAETLVQLDLRQSQFHSSELLLEAIKKGFRVVEVPITIRRRQGGVSKKPPSLRYAFGFLRAIISTWLR